ncbi:MAG TPA: YceI family protein [Acidimicrobiales bacterium]|nr:YceI family protein [Acidimicrobiales bacterium]
MSTAASPAPAALPLGPGRWALDPAHSSVVFSIRHLGLSKVWGRFDRIDAALDVGDSVEDTTVEATIDMTSVDTNQPERDAHLRSTDFFDTDRQPQMRFRSTRIRSHGDSWLLEGEVTLNGITRPMTLEVEFNGVETFPGREAVHAGFSASGEMKRSDFGIDFGILPIGIDKVALADKVRFDLDLQFVAPPALA